MRAQKNETERRYKAENREKYRASRRKIKYGLQPEQFDALMERQRGMCAICLSFPQPGKALDVDHEHQTNTVRGLLCRRCNNAIGLIDDSPWRLRRAASYVETWGRPV